MKHLHFSLKKQKSLQTNWTAVTKHSCVSSVYYFSNICTQKKNSGGDTDPCGVFVYGSKYLLNMWRKAPAYLGEK